MPPDEQDVTSESSADTPVETTATESSPSVDVTAEETADGADRPFKNYKAEVDRKLTKVERQVQEQNTLLQTLLTRLSQPQPVQPAQREYTDEELWTLAQQGSREAYAMLTQRQMDNRLAQERQVQTRAQGVASALNTLYGKYPALKDPNHPLTQAAIYAKQALVGAGWAPMDHGTDLEAIKAAIADNPDLAVQALSRATTVREAARPAPTTQVDGSTTRRDATKPTKPGVNKASLAIANRMGVKEPEKAQERFQKLMDEGRVSLGSAAILGLTTVKEG